MKYNYEAFQVDPEWGGGGAPQKCLKSVPQVSVLTKDCP